MKSLRPSVLALAAALTAACGDNGGTSTGPMASQVIKTAGDGQVGDAGQALATLEVTVLDQSNTPVAGVAVSWAAASGGGSVNPASAVTGADGKATTTRTLGPNAGTQTTTAAVSGLSPVTFTHVAHVQGATQIAADGGGGQLDTVLATLGTPLSVAVRDENAAPVANVTVTWTAPTGGAVNGAATTTTVTDASGLAGVTLSLGTAAGTQTASAAVAGLQGSPVPFTETAAAGEAVTLAQVAGSSGGAPGSTVTLSVKSSDAYGNPSAGDTVAWAVGTGGGSVDPDTSVTGANGVASTQHTLGQNPGVDSVTATAFGDTVRFGLTIAVAPAVDTVIVGPGIVFSPTTVTIAAGGTVVFQWAPGSITHGVEWLTGPAGTQLPPNSADMTSGSYAATLMTAGTYTYDCTIHGTAMEGSITVQ